MNLASTTSSRKLAELKHPKIRSGEWRFAPGAAGNRPNDFVVSGTPDFQQSFASCQRIDCPAMLQWLHHIESAVSVSRLIRASSRTTDEKRTHQTIFWGIVRLNTIGRLRRR